MIDAFYQYAAELSLGKNNPNHEMKIMLFSSIDSKIN